MPEWIYVSFAACAAAFSGLLPLADAVRAVRDGSDVYYFLAGMMLLAEIARREGVFDWLATHAVRASGGSRARLFALVYGVGIVVTAFLSNDATAVVLTPAVAASVRAAKAEPLPYLFACALIANAASFILPISNPANLVVFAQGMPPLRDWLAAFALPSLCSVAITYAVLRVAFRRELAGALERDAAPVKLGTTGRIAFAGIACTAVALVAASALGTNLGAVTLFAALVVFATVALRNRAAAPAVLHIAWPIVPLVAGLFVLIAAAERTGLLSATEAGLRAAQQLPAPAALALAGFVTAVGSNVVNNLPAGLIAGTTVAHAHGTGTIRSAVAIGIDLGPNLSVTGSLATILWLLALRREKIAIDAWHFLRVGSVAMPLALAGAVEILGL